MVKHKLLQTMLARDAARRLSGVIGRADIYSCGDYPCPSSHRPPRPATPNPNLPEDFPPESFALIAFCEACGHQAPLDRVRVPPGVTVQDLPARLRCSGCHCRSCSLRIVYTGAGGFRYGSGITQPNE